MAKAVQDALGSEPAMEFTDAVAAATGGNPFLLGELLRVARGRDLAPVAESIGSLTEMTPEGVSRSLLLRLDSLGSDAKKLAVAVAVLGSDPDRAYAPALAGLDPEAAASCADDLADVRILAPGTELVAAHPLVRQAIYGALSPGERGQAHERAARLLHERAAAAEAVAAHLLEVPPAAAEWVVARLREAAHRATSRGAPARAVEFLRRAMAEPPPEPARAAVARELAEQQAVAGDPAAVDGFRHALELETGPSTRTELALALGRLLFIQTRLHEQRELLLAATEECPDGDHESRLQLAAQILAVDRMLPGDPPPLPARLRFDPDQLAGDTPGERALLVGLALEAVQLARPTDRAVELARRTLGDGRLLSEEGAASATYLNALLVLTLADELETLDTWIERAEDHARRSGDLAGHAAALAFGTNAAFRRGEIGEAVEQAREALAAATARELPVLIGVAITYALEALVEAGNLAEADALLSGTGMAGELPEIFHFAAILARRGRLRVAQGRTEEGLDDLLDAGGRLVRGRSTNPSFARWRSDAARTLAALGRREEAQELATEELELARATGQPSSIGIALRAVAAAGPPSEAFEPLADAVEVLGESPDRFQEAQALADLGAALRAAGQPTEAREPLRRALEFAVRSGAEPLADRTREELAAAGARPRRVALSGPESLTPSEMRCARMAASGMSNREIAQSLFVTVRAVEMHLTSAYRKLEIGSRRELAEALSRSSEES
ncbi:MAG TPA: LuxR C-terminal-related transcriptional regulator [Thermoleophilaceae bacterium]|nr:LuxR C-terminal-related transcriptional regulator [Thermoleophilaceae bacterium]